MKRFFISTLALLFIAAVSIAGDLAKKDITAENQFTDAIRIKKVGIVVIEDTSSITATITLQVKPDGSSTWIDTGDTFTTEGAWSFDAADEQYRAGVKTGDFTSGTATVYIYEQ
jgi:hypothetical protein